MKRNHKITLGSLGATVAIIAGLFTIIEKTPTVIDIVGEMVKADASEVPDSVDVDESRTLAGGIERIENTNKPKGAK